MSREARPERMGRPWAASTPWTGCRCRPRTPTTTTPGCSPATGNRSTPGGRAIPTPSGSPTDLASLHRWEDYTAAKEAVFFYTDTADAPWTVVKSNDKRRARLEAMRAVLARFDYPEKDHEIVGAPDPAVIGPATSLFEHGERPGRFPPITAPRA